MFGSVFLCVSCVCLCVMSNQSTSKSHVIRVKTSVNLISYCIKFESPCWTKFLKRERGGLSNAI